MVQPNLFSCWIGIKALKKSMSEENLFLIMGSESGITQLVDHFYDVMESTPEVEKIRVMHRDFSISREKLRFFLIGRFGGPPLYLEKYGSPRMRARHLPFKIAEAERDQWLFCMDQALQKMNYPTEIEDGLFNWFTQFAEMMRNC